MSKLIYTGIVKVKTSRALKFTFQDTRSIKGHNFFHRLEFTLRLIIFFTEEAKKLPYFVHRTKNHNMPVYLLKKGPMERTQIVKVDGEIKVRLVLGITRLFNI